MASLKKRSGYSDTEEGLEIMQELQQMTGNSSYNTTSVYSTNAMLYPDNLIPFVNRHMNYLINHPLLDADKYLANLKLMTQIR